MKGTIKFFNPVKGFGFIKGDDGKDYFVHCSELELGNQWKPDDKVDFVPIETEKGFQAKKVKKS